MRGSLKKPSQHFQSNIQRLAPSRIDRELRAKLTPKNRQIDRFGTVSESQPNSRAPAKTVSGEVIQRRAEVKAASKAAPAPLPSMVTSVSHQKLERMLDDALLKADAHKQALRYHAARHFWHKRVMFGRRRWVTLSAIVLVIAAGVFAAWERVPQLSVKLAGVRAHLSTAVPAYKPDGYSMAGPAKAESGAVTITYKSAKNNQQNYQIRQAQSNLTSNLVAQNVVPKGASVQTSEVEGNTVYIYGNDNDAVWVNNGVLYTIKDHASLNSDELIKIVKGLNP